ncbi:MAG: GGDEF domain-containing protein [Rhizobiaceae bacterium]
MFRAQIKAHRSRLSSSLRARVLLLIVAIFAAIAVPSAFAFTYFVDSAVLKLGTLFAEKQIQYDRLRGLEMLNREVGLAETLTRSPSMIAWAEHESSPEQRARGLAELERYRLLFRDQSYFFVHDATGNYYFNDSSNSFAGRQLRYSVRAGNPRDGWYFKTIAGDPGCQLNVDNDDNLRVTKVWINCIVEHGGKRLGVLGTGIDLSTFINQVVNSGQDGIQSLFVDGDGAVQASADRNEIDFHSLTKTAGERKTIYQMLDDADERLRLEKMMAAAASGGQEVSPEFMHLEGRRVLIGIGYLNGLDWYNVTILDSGKVIDRGLFWPLAALLAVVMAAAAGLVTWLFKRSVLDRLARMEQSVNRIEAGDYGDSVDQSPDEIGRLSQSLHAMAEFVRDNTKMLELAVRERTQQLELIAYVDHLTGIANRRGFTQSFHRKHDASKPPLGLLLLDIDGFKTVNDRFGHTAGDEIVIQMANRLTETVGTKGVCARWGGDEFAILIIDCNEQTLQKVAFSIVNVIRARPFNLPDNGHLPVTASVGASLVTRDDTLDSAASHADLALYAAKNAGRNRVVTFSVLAGASADAKVA